MSDNPWLKFYPRDWRGDQALRAVSIAARGLWMECLCIMHEATPYGHLMLNGKPVEDDALSRMAGVSVDEVARLMAELRQAGVLSVTRKGVVFSRRMTKDHARAQKGKAAVKKRWKNDETGTAQASDTKQKSDAPNRYHSRSPITQKPEARSQIKEVDKSTSCPFSEFWKIWPNRTAKAAAEKAWARLAEDDRAQAIAQTASWFERWRSAHPTASPIHAATFLNQKRWRDEFQPQLFGATGAAGPGQAPPSSPTQSQPDVAAIMARLEAEGRI